MQEKQGHSIFCFPAGTKITLWDGKKRNIENIQIGDMVLSFNEETYKIEPKKVINFKTAVHTDLVHYKMEDGSKITSTHSHPFYVNDYDLASFNFQKTNRFYDINTVVGEINEGDTVYKDDGKKTKIKEIQLRPSVRYQTYIITVEENNNFYANGILVHNK